MDFHRTTGRATREYLSGQNLKRYWREKKAIEMGQLRRKAFSQTFGIRSFVSKFKGLFYLVGRNFTLENIRIFVKAKWFCFTLMLETGKMFA